MVVQACERRIRLPVDRRKAGTRKDSHSGDRSVGGFYPGAQGGNEIRRRGIVRLAQINLVPAASRIRIAMRPKPNTCFVRTLREAAGSAEEGFLLLFRGTL
jgi:hypothetical protein